MLANAIVGSILDALDVRELPGVRSAAQRAVQRRLKSGRKGMANTRDKNSVGKRLKNYGLVLDVAPGSVRKPTTRTFE